MYEINFSIGNLVFVEYGFSWSVIKVAQKIIDARGKIFFISSIPFSFKNFKKCLTRHVELC